MGAAKPALGQQRRLEGAVARAVPGCQHLAGEVVQGVVSFWRESRTNHVGRLSCLPGPQFHQFPLPLAGPIQSFGHRNSQWSRRKVGGGTRLRLSPVRTFLGPLAPFYRRGNRGTKRSNCPRLGLDQKANFWILRAQWAFPSHITVIKFPPIFPQFLSESPGPRPLFFQTSSFIHPPIHLSIHSPTQ